MYHQKNRHPASHLAAQRLVVWSCAALILCFWVSRIIAIDSFPPFIDETIHINISEQGYQISPLIYADLGRVFTGWWHMLFQTHAAGSMWIARVITVLAVMPGVAAIMAVGRLEAGLWGGILAGLLYLFSAYHLFFERLALSDPLSGSAVSLALYFACRLSRRFNYRDAALTGGLLFVAFGAKVGAVPFFGIPLAAALTLHPHKRAWNKQIRWFALSLIVAVGLTTAFVIGLRVLGHDLLSNSFSYAATNRQTASQEQIVEILSISRIADNALHTVSALASYTGTAAFILCSIAALVLAVRRQFYLPLCLTGPALAMWISRPQETRYWITPMAILLLSGAIVLARTIRGRQRRYQVTGVVLVLLWGLVQWLPFAVTAAQRPVDLPVAETDRAQYINSDAAGFGLNEVRDYLKAHNAINVIGVLPNCQGLHYISQGDFELLCPRINPNGQDIETLANLMENNRAADTYVVLEDSPYTPKSAPGKLLTVIERPVGKASLSIYDLAP